MTLTLVVPGLLWPRQVMRDTLYGTDFPALQTLLGKGRRLASTARSVEEWWHQYFHADTDGFAAAPLRLSAFGQDPGADRWLCVDPVHLRLDQKGATLTDPALLNISAAEARQLHAALAPVFANAGELVVTTPSQWHLRMAKPATNLPVHLSPLIENSAVALLPAGDEGREWRQLINEAQMVLHAHPLNAERGEQGKAIINGIALWGEGRSPVLPQLDPSVLLSDDLIVTGACRLAGIETGALPPRFTSTKASCTVYWDRLRFPAARRDALAWRDVLGQLEQDWMAPALAAGDLKRIELHGFGDDEGISIAMTSLDRHCFWRKPRRLETL